MIRFGAVGLWFFGMAPLVACAQGTPGADAGDDPGWKARLAEADALYESRRTPEALTLLEGLLSDRTGDYEALWRAARAAFGLGVLEVEIDPVRDRFYERAVEYAEQAAATEPERTDGHYWLAAARGRQALHAGVGERTVLAGLILESAERVIALDPEHAGAHHVLGKLYFEIRSVSGFKRWMGGMFLEGGSVLGEASWEKARHHLERAVHNDPEVIVYRLDLAMLYEKLDEDERAARQLESILTMDARDPFDRGLKDDARALLDRLRD